MRCLLIGLVGIACAGGVAHAAETPRRPNIILVMADDVGYGDFSCLGNPILRTPNVDAFARRGVRFTDFHVSPTCAPTRAALMTGRHEFFSGVTHTILERERLSLKATTLAQVLKSSGYATGIFGKWHLGDEAPYQPDRRGFDEAFIHGGGGIGQTFPGSCGDAPGNTYFDPVLLHNGTFEKTRGYCTDLFFGRALQWMDEVRKGAAPFFASIPLNAAHEPLQCPEEYSRRHAGEVPEKVAKFYGMIENIDDNFGALLRKLEEWGLEDNTLVIFMTDNGGTAGTPIFNAGMRGAKGTPYQGGTRVPSFWRWPAGFRGGVDVAALTAHIDIFPTLAEIAGVEPSEGVRRQVEGRSLVPLLKDSGAEWPDRALITHVGRWDRGRAAQSKYTKCSIRNGRFTLVHNTELYDLKADPGETTNVIAEHPDVTATLRAIYDRWWEEILPCLENEDAIGPKINPFKERYWKQFGGGPDEAVPTAPASLPISSPGGAAVNSQGREPLDQAQAVKLPPFQGSGHPPVDRLPRGSRPWLLTAAPPGLNSFRAGAASRPNIVFIIADDLGWRDLGCYGSTFHETPNLDRLAAQGMRFTDAYAACPVCSPTRASILTGKSPARIPLTDYIPGARRGKLNPAPYLDHLPLEEFSIAEALKEGGYTTAFLGKWHLGGPEYYPEHQGFDVNVGGCEKGSPPSYFSPYRIPNLPDGPEGEYLTDRLTNEAIRFIEGVRGKPFFVYLSHYAVHNPQQAKAGLVRKYRAKAASLPPAGGPEFLPEGTRPARQTQNQPVYAAMVESLDESVGRIMKRLAELGLEEDTILVFTSDNGGLSTSEGSPTSNVPLRAGKGWHYEGGVREPLIVKWPGVARPGSVCRDAMISTDYYPTLLEMAGLPLRPQQHPDGVSLVPLLKGGTRPDRALFWHYPHYGNQGGAPGGAVRWGDDKLIEWFEDDRIELYNLRDDPGETRDLSATMPEKAAALRRQLHDWRTSVNARMPTPNPDRVEAGGERRPARHP